MGLVLWVSCGGRLTASLRRFVASQRPSERIDWLLRAYLTGLIVYSLFPFDLTFDPADIHDKFREGRLRLVPFDHEGLSVARGWELLFDALVYAPVGLLSRRLLTKPQRPVRPLGESLLVGTLLVAAVEFCQLFVMSRFTETLDVVTGATGIFLGAAFLQADTAGLSGSKPEPYAPVLKWFAGALAYAAFLSVFFWWPLEILDDGALVRQRWDRYLSVPFSELQRNSMTSAVTQLVYKTALFVPLGLLMGNSILALGLDRRHRRAALATGIGVGLGFAVLLEAVQSALPPHIPSVTDTLLYTMGYVLGLAIAAALHGRATRGLRENPGDFARTFLP